MKEMIWLELEVKNLQIASSDKPGQIKIGFAVECDELERSVDTGEEFEDEETTP